MREESAAHSGLAILLALLWVLVSSPGPTPPIQGILLGLAMNGVLTVLQRALFRTPGQ